MGPIEVYFITIALIVMIIGVVRGYRRELGSTVIIMTAIFLLTFTAELTEPMVVRLGQRVLDIQAQDVATRNAVLSLVYTLVFIAIVLAGYAGRTLEFPGQEAKEPLRTLLSMAIGLLNGYLIAGTLWYYQDKFDYPAQRWGLILPDFSDTARTLIGLLPEHILPSPTYWMVPIAVLIILRVRG